MFSFLSFSFAKERKNQGTTKKMRKGQGKRLQLPKLMALVKARIFETFSRTA
jgi:hypothetical protein